MARKNILLIGASGGLGKHFALGLAKSGYNLALHYHDGLQKIKILQDLLGDFKITFKSYKADITSENEVKNLIENVNKDFGSLDILINNAGISLDGVSWKLGLDEWNRVLNVNLTGPFLCIKHSLPVMRKNNWGRIVNISSVVAQTGVPGTSAYSASKAGIFGLTKSISKEVANKNITINTIALGYFNEGMIAQVPEELKTKIKSAIPKNVFGEPIDIVNCIHFLIEDTSSYVTGQTININGGLY